VARSGSVSEDKDNFHHCIVIFVTIVIDVGGNLVLISARERMLNMDASASTQAVQLLLFAHQRMVAVHTLRIQMNSRLLSS
jgi:hypothetical protein